MRGGGGGGGGVYSHAYNIMGWTTMMDPNALHVKTQVAIKLKSLKLIKLKT